MACIGKAHVLHLANNPGTEFDLKTVPLPDLIRRPHTETDELKSIVSTIHPVDTSASTR